MIEVNNTVVCNNNKPLPGNDVAPPLTVGDRYPIKEIFICGCGKRHFNVGLPLTYNHVRCVDCQENLPTTNHWAHPSRFELIQED